MPIQYRLESKEIGQLRIYMAQHEKKQVKSLRQRLFGRSLYKEIISVAKQAGILNATVHHTYYGYSGYGKIQAAGMSDIDNKSLNLYVELISPRSDLEQFVQNNGALLKGKVLVFKDMEHWDVK